MTDRRLTGGCLCGAARYEIEGEPVTVAICHRIMCRRAHAAPVVAWAMFQEPQVRFTEGRPTTYESSTEARRGFCPTCGTQISFTASYIPGLIDIAAGSFERPEALTPTLHYWYDERLPCNLMWPPGWPLEGNFVIVQVPINPAIVSILAR